MNVSVKTFASIGIVFLSLTGFYSYYFSESDTFDFEGYLAQHTKASTLTSQTERNNKVQVYAEAQPAEKVTKKVIANKETRHASILKKPVDQLSEQEMRDYYMATVYNAEQATSIQSATDENTLSKQSPWKRIPLTKRSNYSVSRYY